MGAYYILWALIITMVWLRNIIDSLRPAHVFDINDTIAYAFMVMALVLVVMGVTKLIKKK